MRETGDPEVLAVEYDYDVSATAGSRTLQVSSIQVSRVRHGRIIHSRDYHNHVVLADATGQRSAVVAAMTSLS
jgi:ketosteroid isomerase-like protein